MSRTITTLLAVVAVLLGLNLVTGFSRANAQAANAARAARPVSITTVADGSDRWIIFRLWGDGHVDANSVSRAELQQIPIRLPLNNENSGRFEAWVDIEAAR